MLLEQTVLYSLNALREHARMTAYAMDFIESPANRCWIESIARMAQEAEKDALGIPSVAYEELLDYRLSAIKVREASLVREEKRIRTNLAINPNSALFFRREVVRLSGIFINDIARRMGLNSCQREIMKTALDEESHPYNPREDLTSVDSGDWDTGHKD